MTRLAIVGIDGATYEIIRPMVAQGELPHISRVLAEGVSGDLESEKPPITPPAWTSMMTGVNPGRHGVYHFIRREIGSYDCRLHDSRGYAGKDLMSLLTGRGWRVGALNVPMTYPPFPLAGGYMVSGIPMPLSGEGIAWPSGLLGDLGRILGHAYRPDLDYTPWEGDVEETEDDLDRYAVLRDELLRVERDRLVLVRRLLRDRPTDLFFTVVSITDRAQHYFWKFQDPSHAGYSQEGARRYGEVIRDAYRLADEFVGAVREACGPETAVALVSDHGFGPYRRDFHVNRWLEEEGFLVRRKPPYWTWGRIRLGELLARLGLAGLARRLGPLARLPLARPKRKLAADLRDVDWSKTQAWCALHGLCVNLQGREPQGSIAPGAAGAALLARLEERLLLLRDGAGKPVVDYTVRAADVYHGPRAAEAPDLQFQMQGLACLPKDDWDATELFTERRNSAVSGQHRFNGVFAYAAPGLAPARILRGMHIRDTTPTLLHGVGSAVPRWMEGRVQREIHDPPREPLWDDGAEPSGGGAPPAYSAEQSAAISESLKALGYLQ